MSRETLLRDNDVTSDRDVSETHVSSPEIQTSFPAPGMIDPKSDINNKISELWTQLVLQIYRNRICQ